MKSHVNVKNCDCLECNKNANYKSLLDDRRHTYNGGSQIPSIGLYKGQTKKDSVDEIPKTADYFVNATLLAKKPVKIFSNTDHTKATVIKEVGPGSIVGEVFSWVKDKDGNLWWQLKEGGFVKHAVGLFDPKIATNSSSGKQQEIFNKLANAGANWEFKGFSDFTKDLIKGVIITIIGALVVYILLKKI